MPLRFHEISEHNHKILNPFTSEKLQLLGEICRLEAGVRQLDLACGKGELLCQWAARYGVMGIGVDVSEVFLNAARERAAELNVTEHVTFIQQEAATYLAQERAKFDIVSCIGATWIGGGLVGTLELMRPRLRDDKSLLLIGEPFWREAPPSDAYEQMEIAKNDFTSLAGTLTRFERVGFELLEMVLADENSWDRYVASQWFTVSDWLRENADDPDAPAIQEWITRSQRNYLAFERRCLGWGVFVLRQDVLNTTRLSN